jgi:hypothetical protein
LAEFLADLTDITTGGNLTLWVGNHIGKAVAPSNPLEVAVGGRLNVGTFNDAPNHLGEAYVWAFLAGTSGDGAVHYVGDYVYGDNNKVPGAIIWNTAAWGGPEWVLNRLDSIEGGFTREMLAMAELYQGSAWNYQFLYFPLVWGMLDRVPAVFNLEYILDGGGSIEGLPAGVGPGRINLNEMDDTFSMNF